MLSQKLLLHEYAYSLGQSRHANHMDHYQLHTVSYSVRALWRSPRKRVRDEEKAEEPE